MIRSLAGLLLVVGCARGTQSYNSSLTPVQHRVVRALIGATIVWTGEEIGIKPTLALLAGTIGQLAVSKAIMAVRHPDWFGPHSWGDAICDLASASAVLPLWAGRHLRGRKNFDWSATILTGVVWGTWMYSVQWWCIP